MFSRARWRLTLWFAGAFVVILGVIGVAVYGTARSALLNQVNGNLQGRAQRELRPLADQLLQRLRRGESVGDLTIGPAFTTGGYFYAFVTQDGTVIARTTNVDTSGLAPIADIGQVTTSGAKFIDTTSSGGENLRIYLLPVASAGNQQIILEVGRSTASERESLQRLVLILAAGGGAGLVLAVAGGFVLSGRTLRPIQIAMDQQREFVADASHELRTPLTLIRANAEILKRGADKPVEANMMSVDDIIQETDRLSSLVGQMLTLARSDSGEGALETAPVDLSALAADAAREMRLLAEPKRITLNAHTNGPVLVQGDQTRLRELLTILLDNAIKYSDEGSAVSVDASSAQGKAQVQISDTGHGIAAEALPHIFDRFYRADKARSREMGGSGLGLAIAKWIVDSHKGTIRVDSTSGKGTTVTVELPTTPTPSAGLSAPAVPTADS